MILNFFLPFLTQVQTGVPSLVKSLVVNVMTNNVCMSPTTCANPHNIILVYGNILTYTVITLGMVSLLHFIQSYGVCTHGSPVQEVRLRDSFTLSMARAIQPQSTHKQTIYQFPTAMTFQMFKLFLDQILTIYQETLKKVIEFSTWHINCTTKLEKSYNKTSIAEYMYISKSTHLRQKFVLARSKNKATRMKAIIYHYKTTRSRRSSSSRRPWLIPRA